MDRVRLRQPKWMLVIIGVAIGLAAGLYSGVVADSLLAMGALALIATILGIVPFLLGALLQLVLRSKPVPQLVPWLVALLVALFVPRFSTTPTFTLDASLMQMLFVAAIFGSFMTAGQRSVLSFRLGINGGESPR